MRETRPSRRCIGVAVLLLASAFAGCRTYSSQYYVGANDYQLATRELPDGGKETFVLQVAGSPSLRVTTEATRERPFLGFKMVELDKPAAEARGVRPYTGLLIKDVYPDSAAADAGVLKNDVLLTVGGREVVYLSQLAEVEGRLRVDEPVVLVVLRGQERFELSATPKLLRERVTDSELVRLIDAPNRQPPYAGVTLRGIPSAWCERIYGTPREAVVVANVEVGSPAWLAGVRAGDIIDTVDGAPVPSVEELSRRIAELGPAGETLTLQVSRGRGSEHEAAVELSDYSGETRFTIPIVFSLNNGVYEDRWSLLWGLLMRNENSYVPDSSTRRVETRNVFSALLGLIRVDSGPRETDVRLLWLIRFET